MVINFEVKTALKLLKTNKKARYVKVVATTFGNMPTRHQGVGGKAFIFIDEIVIE